MGKKKYKFSPKEFYADTPEMVLKISDCVKALCLGLGGVSAFSHNEVVVAIFTSTYVVSDVIGRFFGRKDDKSTSKDVT